MTKILLCGKIMNGYYSVFNPESKKIADCGSERDALFLIHSRNKTWDGHYYTFNPLPGDIIDANQPRQLEPYVPVASISDDIVVNMDGGVGGSWREISLPENYQEPFIPNFHD